MSKYIGTNKYVNFTCMINGKKYILCYIPVDKLTGYDSKSANNCSTAGIFLMESDDYKKSMNETKEDNDNNIKICNLNKKIKCETHMKRYLEKNKTPTFKTKCPFKDTPTAKQEFINCTCDKSFASCATQTGSLGKFSIIPVDNKITKDGYVLTGEYYSDQVKKIKSYAMGTKNADKPTLATCLQSPIIPKQFSDGGEFKFEKILSPHAKEERYYLYLELIFSPSKPVILSNKEKLSIKHYIGVDNSDVSIKYKDYNVLPIKLYTTIEKQKNNDLILNFLIENNN